MIQAAVAPAAMPGDRMEHVVLDTATRGVAEEAQGESHRVDDNPHHVQALVPFAGTPTQRPEPGWTLTFFTGLRPRNLTPSHTH